MRYFIKFSYNGKNFHGFQTQPNAISVQETLTQALKTVLDSEIEIVGAGRTDTGVHAEEMFAHFDIENSIDVEKTIYKLNSFLDESIAIQDIILVHEEAHARFDAKLRTYKYLIHTQKNVFLNDQSWLVSQNLNIDLMNKACEILKTHTDFECFSKVKTDVATFNCKIEKAIWEQKNEQIIFTISADRFLRNMVRAIVGTMINIGLEKINLSDFETILESKNRQKAGFSAPAKALYLTQIKYNYL